MAAALLLAGATFVSTLAGGVAALRWPGRTELLMALAAGVVLGAAAFDLLPEAVAEAGRSGVPAIVPFVAAVLGYVGFEAAERHLHDHGAGAPGRPGALGTAGATGFTVHSFFDGLAIGLGFQVDPAVGLLVAVAVIGHDFSDGLNTVAYLVAHHHPVERQRRWLLAVAAAPLAGAATGSLLPVPEAVFPVAVGFFAGVFVHAASANLLPRALALPLTRVVPLVLAGAAAMLAISRVA